MITEKELQFVKCVTLYDNVEFCNNKVVKRLKTPLMAPSN